jgi:hypothetical protein
VATLNVHAQVCLAPVAEHTRVAGKQLAQQYLAHEGFLYASSLLSAGPRRLLLAIGFLFARNNLFEACSVLAGQNSQLSTSVPPLPYNCIAQCMPDSTRNDRVSTGITRVERCLSSDASAWEALQHAAHVAQRMQCKHAVLQRQLQSVSCCNVSLTASLVALGEAAGVVVTPYEAAVTCRDAAFEAHMRDAHLLHAELLMRQQTVLHGTAFLAWVMEVHDLEEEEMASRVDHGGGTLCPHAAARSHMPHTELLMPRSMLDCSEKELEGVRLQPVRLDWLVLQGGGAL